MIKTDRCVGFVPSLDENNIPISDSFLATSFSTIENMFTKSPIAKYAYVYMAKPLQQNIPPFLLVMSGHRQ